jgi:uncharacterized protein YjbI with pentapeptide repeats/energy-coupling factor transporter ATP-binding protein EcfA2
MATAGHHAERSQIDGRLRYRDVFPALGAFVSAGLVLGVTAALALAALGRSHGRSVLILWPLGAAIGAILGLFVGLGRGVWRAGIPISAYSPAHPPGPQLWDSWLDSGREEQWRETEVVIEEPAAPAVEIAQQADQRAIVRPRVISPDTHEAVLLEDEIGSLIQKGARGFVQIVGGPGSGKSTALKHLAAILPPWMRERLQLLDDLDPGADNEGDRVVISTAPQVSQPKLLAKYALARWGQDDLIEYLLAAHRERCASVMARLKHSDNNSFLRGVPELWAIVLDLMASDESIADVRSALRRELETRLSDRQVREQIEPLCLTALGLISKRGKPATPDLRLYHSAHLTFDPELFRLVRHQPVMVLLAADWLARLADAGRVHRVLLQQLSRELIHECALRLSGNPRALQHLREWIGERRLRAVHPVVASLLHAVMPDWRPEPVSCLLLEGAYLDGVKWSGVNLELSDIRSADLGEAELCGANLEQADARSACFRRADLRGASLASIRAVRADLSGADLRWTKAKQAIFEHAKLTAAVLIDAELPKADLRNADINQADFSGANLEDACLTGLDLRIARFEQARFGGADLRFCNFEEMRLTAPDFHDANLQSALLTASSMPEANFLGADLRNAGLAEVDWPGANLHDADLRGANFHLGSSRNGLVGSPIACEGSRTGFYTDDYDDQNVKPAEEIRKANLRGADLRGADIQDVDFYLVDLRNAQYTADQAKHLRNCRAILEDRVVG